MANRILRDWTTSEKMENLSIGAEVFFTRLIMKADDYGSFHANSKLLKAALFPLKDYTLQQIDDWLSECITNGLIGSYDVEGKRYIRIINFGQRLQNMRNAFPGPQGDFNEVTVSHRESPPETKRSRNEVEVETKGKDPDFNQFDLWGKEIIDGNDFVFTQKFRNEFPNWGGGPEKFAEVVNDHFDLLSRYPKMNPNTQERFRNSLIKHFREYKGKQNGTGKQTNKGTEHIAGLMEGYKRRHGGTPSGQ